MGLSINTNVAALNAYRNLSSTQGDLSKSLEKLSSGFRINRAADDAAGLAISEGMRSQIGGIKMGVRNAQDGISVVQTAEGALNETHSILQRMRDLSVQAANTGSLNDEAKSNIQTEVEQLNKELTRIADTTQFNGKKLLDGNYSGTFQVGANVGETIEVEVGKNMSAEGLGLDEINVAPVAASKTFSAAVTTTAGTVTVDGGAAITIAQDASLEDIAGAINGAGQAGLTASVVDSKLQIQKEGVTGALGVTFGTVTATEDTAAAVDGAAGSANDAITAIDAAIKSVSSTRSDLGAVQNRFEHTINNLNVAVENLSASESRIRDTDMASEMVSFTRAQILSQAGTAMLAQAKSIPQGVLQLLQ
ncbi:flagellin [Flavimobilis marinus]|uniref:Flagellin n=1 Tax=Flavimobilis marinus TaxID=285351 RepID=A0A1I2GRX1_9MICO|nr:flagellin [Flavimobilis marinus]GHG55759.1 flagellin [Flavimobilis marinus]SFF19426.1 flagellin [Flavimobilis marinus]